MPYRLSRFTPFGDINDPKTESQSTEERLLENTRKDCPKQENPAEYGLQIDKPAAAEVCPVLALPAYYGEIPKSEESAETYRENSVV